MTDGIFEKPITLCILQITNVLAEEGVFPPGQADRVLQLTADGKDRRLLIFQKYRNRNKPPRAPQMANSSFCGAHDGIITAQEDVAVVHQEEIRQGVESLQSLLIVNGDRLFAEVAAGHDQSAELTLIQQQVMQRGVRQKDPEVAVSG